MQLFATLALFYQDVFSSPFATKLNLSPNLQIELHRVNHFHSSGNLWITPLKNPDNDGKHVQVWAYEDLRNTPNGLGVVLRSTFLGDLIFFNVFLSNRV